MYKLSGGKAWKARRVKLMCPVYKEGAKRVNDVEGEW
jgi:hypothetical protein